MKLAKVLCSMFLLAILGVDPAQGLAKYKRWLHVLMQQKHCDYVIHA